MNLHERKSIQVLHKCKLEMNMKIWRENIKEVEEQSGASSRAVCQSPTEVCGVGVSPGDPPGTAEQRRRRVDSRRQATEQEQEPEQEPEPEPEPRDTSLWHKRITNLSSYNSLIFKAYNLNLKYLSMLSLNSYT